MRHPIRQHPALAVAFLALATALALQSCQDAVDPPGPEMRRAKLDQTLTVTGAGSGSGKVTAPEFLDQPALECIIVAGTYDPITCSQVYPWKAVIELTAIPDPGSTLTWSGACSGTAIICRVVMARSREVRATFSGQSTPSYALQVAGAGTGDGTVASGAGTDPAVACTITAGTGEGACGGSYLRGTVVRLGATPGSGSTFHGWSGACTGTGSCEVTVTENLAVTATFMAPPGPEATVGRWDSPALSPIIGLHASYLPNGRVLTWGNGGEPHLLDPSGGGFTQVTHPACSGTGCDLFCTGHTYLADGRLLVAGGHDHSKGDGHGITQASTFDGSSWAMTGSMTYGRWYPTLVTLADGAVVALGGSSEPGVGVPTPERFNGSGWTALTGANQTLPAYPRAFVEPKLGRVFVAGEGTPRFLDPTGSGRWTSAPARVVTIRSYGAAVMLDSKVLYLGGGGGNCAVATAPEATAEVIDLAATTPAWSLAGSMNFPRRQLNATILPDGTVLVTGGTSACGFSAEGGAVFAAEVWNPAGGGSFTTWANASVVRVYHSTAVLLRDGRVLVTGSGDGGGITQQHSYQVFSPPYLFKGPRPVYNLPSAQLRYGEPFLVSTAAAPGIAKVTMIRQVSTTHAFDMGQRLNTLGFTVGPDGRSLVVTPPGSGREAPPGPYLLFILDGHGVPSVAQTILVGP